MLTAAARARLGELACAVDCGRVRVHLDGRVHALVMRLSRGRAVALGNRIFLPPVHAHDLATLAHELTHCAQYQAWGPLRYYLTGFVEQSRDLLHRVTGLTTSPYRWAREPGKPFAAYGMEQQGQIVEDAFRGDPVAAQVSPYLPPA